VIEVEVSAQFSNYRPADNVSLSGRVSWSSNGPLEMEGTLDWTVKGNPIRFTVTGSFSDADNWTLYSRFDGGEQGLAIGNPTLLKLKLLEGTLSRHGGKLKISVKGEATDISLSGLGSVHSAEVEFTTDCKFQRETTGTAEGVCLQVKLKSELTLPGKPSLKVTGAVKVDFSTGKFEASGSVSLSRNDPIGKAIGLHDVEMFVTNAGPPENAVCKSVVRPAAAGGLYYGLTAQGKALGLTLHFSGAYLGGDHFCLAARIGSASLPSGNSDNLTQIGTPPKAGETRPAPDCAAATAPTLQNLTFAYSSDTEEGQFSGAFCFPSGVRKELGAAGTGNGSVDLFLSKSGGFKGDASFDLGRTLWFLNAKNNDTPDSAKAALGFRTLTVSVGASPATGLSLSFAAGGELSLPAPTRDTGGGGQPSRALVSLAVEIALNPAPKLTIEGNVGQSTGNQPCNPRLNPKQVAITNAFGADGFDICHFGFNGSIALTGFSLGVNASFKLPTKWGPELGVHNASLKIGFNISAQTPCLNLEIEKADPNGRAAIDLLNKGAIVANSAALRIAPSGCSLPGGTRLDPGISLKFDGTMFGTATSVDLAITRKDPGLKIDFTQRTGASSLGPLKFGATNIRVLLDAPQTQLELHTSIRIGDHGGVKIDGSLNHSGTSTTLKASACLLANVPPPNAPGEQSPPCGAVTLLGASFTGNVNLDFSSGPGLKADVSGRLKADLKLLDLDVDLRSLIYDSTNTRNPGLQKLDIAVNTGFNLGPVGGRLAGSVKYTAEPKAIELGLSGHVRVWGFEPSFELKGGLPTKLPFSFGPGEGKTTRISAPKTLVVLRLKGDLKGDVSRAGAVEDVKLMPIQGCFPFETVCVDIGDAKVNTANGQVMFKAFGYDVVIDASKYVKNTPGQVDYSPGISYVANDSSGKCLDVDFGNFADGTRIKQEACSKTRNTAQEFKLLADGTLRARNAEGKDFCVRGVAAGNGSDLQLAGCAINQSGVRWYRDNLGHIKGGYANHGHLCLDINSASNQPGALRLDGCRGDAKSQRWVIVDLIRHPASPRVGCLDVPRGDLTSELKVFPDCNRTVNQAFAMYPNGELKVRGQCVAAAIKTGATLKLEDCTGAPTPQQRWSLDFGQLCVGETDVPGSARGSGGDFRDARCIAPLAKQGDFFPVELRPFNETDSNQKWDVTY
jgi:hypothetical protein